MKALYRVLVSTPKNVKADLEFYNGENLIRLTKVSDYDREALKKLYGIVKLNHKTNGLKLTKPIVHSTKRLVVVKIK